MIKKLMIKAAINSKLSNIENSCQYTHAVWDKVIFDKIRTGIFGGRVGVCVSGSAPLSKDVLNFF